MAVEIREHVPGEDLDAFVRAAHVVFASDPAWVPPLELELRARLTPAKNPFFRRGEVSLFTAWRDGRLLGRVSAQLDHEHLRRYRDRTGFFGFFATVDDVEVGEALLDAARAWLRRRGMRRMRGPLSLHMNEELGLLVDGFEHPPMVLMSHSRSWQGRIAEAAGLAKAKDLWAWRFDVGAIPQRALRAWAQVRELPEVRLRSVDPRRMAREIAVIQEIYNDAWKDNWGYVPATKEAVEQSARDLRLLLDPEMAFIAEVNDRPVGMCVCLPNLNEVIRDFGGRLGPVRVGKLLWRLKVQRPHTARLMMLGIHADLRGQKRYAGLSHALYVEVAKRGERRGVRWGELSWTLEDNARINLGIRSMGARVYKTYRIYEQDLDGHPAEHKDVETP
ncbi:MAG: hypothetical protein ACFCGT_10655 [Sandaracinaceae bacterium]